MKAAVNHEAGGPDVLRYEDVPDPEPGDGDVLVRVEAVSIEGGDTLGRGETGGTDGRPHIVGYQAAGTVIAAGSAVVGLAEGDRVVTVGLDGSHAELRAVPESFCWPVPDGLAIEQAACIPIPFGTADDCLFEFGRLQPGETALIHAGASGVGIAAIQLAKRAGARVLATASRDDKLERLAAFGLDHGINYVATRLRRRGPSAHRRSRGGRHRRLGRWRDPAEQPAVPRLPGEDRQRRRRRARALGPARRLDDAGQQPELLGLLPRRRALPRRPSGPRPHLRPHRRRRRRRPAGRDRPHVSRSPTPAAAHAYIESRQSFGRVVLIP